MGIGRSFIEALQKSCQSLENNRIGLGADGKNWTKTEDIVAGLEKPNAERLFRIKDAMALGMPVKSIQKLTGIDTWFLRQIEKLVVLEKELEKYKLEEVPAEFLRELKQAGYSDLQIAYVVKDEVSEDEVFALRKKYGIKRQYKLVDTCSAEFEAKTPYYYSTFDGENESVRSDRKKIIVLGSGPNRIGQGIEFDYCCVHGLLAIKEAGYEAIMVNCNPETVSTDFDVADKLYFEPVFWEHLIEIVEHEQPEGVIVQLGGQTALKLAERLTAAGIKIIGTSYKDLDLAEDRGAFSDMLKALDIPYPEYGVAWNVDDALEVVKRVGYPVLVRPSYVLGGQRMKIVIDDEDLEKSVISLLKHIPDNKILIDHFLDRAKEAEIDAICDGEDVQIMGIMEHIEPAGIHSGDSNSVLPPFSLGQIVIDTMVEYTKRLAMSLNTVGLINIQFAIKNDKVFVIEANPRASRSMPFIAKAHKVPYLNYATKVMIGANKLKDFKFEPKLTGFAIKEPVFSYHKFPEVQKELGPEMKSTGEAIRFIKDLKDPYFRQLYSEKSMYLSK
jgi:carbamoyl-phosphate synthase large subunit